MDYETKIYLEKFIEAIEELNSPDWWTIVLAITNFVMALALTIWQICLNKKQTKFQEYESYKDLYKLIKEIHFQSNSILSSINRILCVKYYKESYAIHLHKLNMEICSLSTEFSKSQDDLELKVKLKDNAILNYTLILLNMTSIVSKIEDYVENQIIDISILEYDDKFHNDDIYIERIIASTDKSKKAEMRKCLDEFVHTKKCIQSYNVLNTLKKHCSF